MHPEGTSRGYLCFTPDRLISLVAHHWVAKQQIIWESCETEKEYQQHSHTEKRRMDFAFGVKTHEYSGIYVLCNEQFRFLVFPISSVCYQEHCALAIPLPFASFAHLQPLIFPMPLALGLYGLISRQAMIHKILDYKFTSPFIETHWYHSFLFYSSFSKPQREERCFKNKNLVVDLNSCVVAVTTATMNHNFTLSVALWTVKALTIGVETCWYSSVLL